MKPLERKPQTGPGWGQGGLSWSRKYASPARKAADARWAEKRRTGRIIRSDVEYLQLQSRPVAQNLRIREVLGNLGYRVYGRDCLTILVPEGRTREDVLELVQGAVGEQPHLMPRPEVPELKHAPRFGHASRQRPAAC